MLENISNRAKSAFVLALAERAKLSLFDMPHTVSLIESALSDAWSWVEGNSVSGDSIYLHIAREGDEGIAFELEKATTECNKNSINTALTAMCYVDWIIYKENKSSNMPEPICEVSDEAIDLTVDYFNKCRGNDKGIVGRLISTCNKYKTNEVNDSGRAIFRAEFTSA